jgi:hypothetical protein
MNASHHALFDKKNEAPIPTNETGALACPESEVSWGTIILR